MLLVALASAAGFVARCSGCWCGVRCGDRERVLEQVRDQGEGAGESTPWVTRPLVEKLPVEDFAFAVEDVIRPLEGNRLVRARPSIERQGRAEGLEIHKVDREPETSELGGGDCIVEPGASPYGVEHAKLQG